VDPGPPELERRYRRFLEGKGDAVAPLLCYIGSDREARAGSGAWAALIVSRIFLLKGNAPLAHAYLRLAAALSGTGDRADSSGAARDATLRLGILVNRALVLKAQGRIRQAAELLRAIVDRASSRLSRARTSRSVWREAAGRATTKCPVARCTTIMCATRFRISESRRNIIPPSDTRAASCVSV
jgi:hypothetical protein